MTDERIIDFDTAKLESIHRHEQRGYFSLRELRKYPDISSSTVATGWWELDQIFKVYPGQFVVVTGLAGSGKSTFLFNMLMTMARIHGTRSFMYVPENERHLHSKLRSIWPGNDAGFEHYGEFQCFVQSAAPDDYDTSPQDLSWVLNKAIVAIEKDGVDVLLIDPWNELEHAKPPNMLMTDYIRLCLMYLKQFARAYDVTVILVAHPTKAVTENGGRTPLLSDIEGSMNWYNKCDNGLIVVRDYEKKTTRVISAKVRELGAGKIGQCWFNVDPDTGIFIPQYGGVSEERDTTRGNYGDHRRD